VYQVQYGREARAQADSLPPAGRQALADAIEQLGRDPWAAQRLPSYPSEFRSRSFGDWGLVVYLIRERQATVVLLDLIWAGPDPRSDRGS
jgi:mRNA-degrading endonuclease RelE of RelBE toxin-antitoxin system